MSTAQSASVSTHFNGSGLSSEDFELFQRQYLALREEKYALESERNQLLLRVGQLEDKLQQSETTLQGLQTVLAKLKQPDAVQALVEERQELCLKVSMAETNFRQQTKILQDECDSLLLEKKRLLQQLDERAVAACPSADPDTETKEPVDMKLFTEQSQANAELEESVVKLRGQVTVLEATLEKERLQHDSVLREELERLENAHSVAVMDLNDKLEIANNSRNTLDQVLQELRIRQNEIKLEIQSLHEQQNANLASSQAETEQQLLELRETMSDALQREVEAAKQVHEETLQKSRDTCNALRSNHAAMQKKFEKQLQSLQKDYDKEVRHRTGLQETLVELRAQQQCHPSTETLYDYSHKHPASVSSLISTNSVSNKPNHDSVEKDDDSLDKSTLSRTLVDAEGNNSNLLESDLMATLNRLVETQDENSTLRAKMTGLEKRLNFYKAQITSKDEIIQRYIDSQVHHVNVSSQKRDSVESPPHSASDRRSSFSFNLPSRPFSTVRNKNFSSAELQQLRNFCEELMTRNLILEERLNSLFSAEDNNQPVMKSHGMVSDQ